MPLTVPPIDARNYQQLRDEALRRVPVHNPEWTNLGESDPGVTLVELFAFLTESLLYRANQIPERNRRKFLQLLNLPLRGASAAEALLQISNDRGPLQTVTLPTGFRAEAGAMPFLLEQGMDVLPVEALICVKRRVPSISDATRAYYNQLYASFLKPELPAEASLYELTPLAGFGETGVDLAADTVDGTLWIALAARRADVAGLKADALEATLLQARKAIAGKTLTLGLVPQIVDASIDLRPGGAAQAPGAGWRCSIAQPPADGLLPEHADERVPRYRPLSVVGDAVLARPGTVQIPLPGEAAELQLWRNLEPLEAGVGDFPPAVDDTDLDGRVITWLRLSLPAGSAARLLWAGINCGLSQQRERIAAERLPLGTGAPEQKIKLARQPVLPASVRVFVTADGASVPVEWQAVDDLYRAGPELPLRDARLAPGALQPPAAPSQVFQLDAEAGELRFGDGAHGARPPLGAALAADYEVSAGRAGNVPAGAIKGAPGLAAGFKVSNPLPAWGGADAETQAEGEKQVQRWLQHRDRLVSAADFEAITWRCPGVEIGRVDVVPASSPAFGLNEPGDAPGVVTLMLLPRRDAQQPEAPRPDRLFLDQICAWLEPRRLVTTELVLRGPVYKPVWVSVGIEVAGEASVGEVRQAVEAALRAALAVLPVEPGVDGLLPVFRPGAPVARGWPLRRAVVALELAAAVARVSGVTGVRELQLSGATDSTPQTSISMRGLELPRLMGVSVSLGAATAVTDLRGVAGQGASSSSVVVPVPTVPTDC